MKRKAPGILLHDNWLNQHGFSGLVAVMHKHPKSFAHIRQRSGRGRTNEEQVCEAEKLAKKHGGMLPSTYWLQNNGFGWLVSAMWHDSEPFAHIKQKRLK